YESQSPHKCWIISCDALASFASGYPDVQKRRMIFDKAFDAAKSDLVRHFICTKAIQAESRGYLFREFGQRERIKLIGVPMVEASHRVVEMMQRHPMYKDRPLVNHVGYIELLRVLGYEEG